MAHFIGIKQPDGQIKPIMDFENSTPVKISLTPVRDEQDKVLIPFYYVDTENQEYTIELGSFTIDYRKRPVQKDDQLILHLKINKKGALRVELMQPQHKVKVFNIFKFLKKKQRSKRVELAKELKLTPRPEKKETPGQAGKQEAEGKPKTQPFKIILLIIYALILAVIIFFLITQTFEELSLEKLFGIKL